MNIYMDVYANNNNFLLTWHNVFLLVVCASIAALKYNEDTIFPLSYFAEVVGIETIRLTDLQDKFLEQIKFKLFVNQSIYKQYYKIMIKS